MASSPRRRAIILDFNGVVADDESPHFDTFQQALREAGIELSAEEYYGRFLGMDERTCARLLLAELGGEEEARLARILTRKALLFEAVIRSRAPPLFPGIADFVRHARERYELAIASGGLRRQIDAALRSTPIERAFRVIVSAEDAPMGKPDPTLYRIALQRLNDGRRTALRPGDCLVVEDSLAGIRSARRAGMRVAAVATTYPAERLVEAELVLPTLDASALARLERLLGG